MAPPTNPPMRHGIREATGTERPSPGILCWNCRTLTPFPSDACKWCGAAFAGSHGGGYEDQLPDRSVRGPVSSPATATVDSAKNLRRIVRRLGVSESAAEARPSAPAPPTARPSPPRGARASPSTDCPVCGSVLPMETDHCFVCGSAFHDAGTMYACPRCGVIVPEAATTCRCGAQFAD